MKRRKQPNRLKLFYYSHPYFVIFNLLIIYNIILIGIAALIMTYIMHNATGSDGLPLMEFSLDSYFKNLEYCVVFTMNTGGIYDQAPIGIIIMKVVLSVIQMITFTGALIGLATSILQSMFDKRIHNIGKIKIKHHYVILEWSAVGANLVRELSFMHGNKTIVILSSKNRDEIQEEIDNLFLETGTSKKHLKLFIKQGEASSRKALKEINIDKAESIAILGASSWLNESKKNDSASFKILMTVLSITKTSNIVIETDDPEVTKNIHDLMLASTDLGKAHISIFSRNTVVGHVLAKTAVNVNYSSLYYSLLSFQNGSFYAIDKPYSVTEALERYSSCLPAFRYPISDTNDKDLLYLSGKNESSIRRALLRKKYTREVSFKKNLIKNSFTLCVIGKNERSNAIKEAVERHNELNEGQINLLILPYDVDVEETLTKLQKEKGQKKILILSDNNASEENMDSNVFLTLIKIKANKDLCKGIETFAEIFDESNKFSLESLNITGVIIANQMVAIYLTQLLCHPESHNFYEDLVIPNETTSAAFEIRLAKELLNEKGDIEFTSRGEFVSALYEASNHEYLPIGLIGEKEQKNIFDSVTGVVTGAVGGAVNLATKMVSNIGNALTLSDTPEEATCDFSNILLFNDHIRKKEKLVIKPDTIIIVVHRF
ncbi:MAG: hypothetical protein J5511_03610 [Bacilli bacterium]|nr:hypothetical protein [Bacilli bacterium]